MSRLTISLSESRCRALKEASASRGKPIGRLIEQSLEFYGIKPREDADAVAEGVRAHQGQALPAAHIRRDC
jgi:hypothetical protein